MKFDKVTPPPAAIAAAIFFVLAWKRTIRLVDISVGGGLMGKRTGKGRRTKTQGGKRFPTFPRGAWKQRERRFTPLYRRGAHADDERTTPAFIVRALALLVSLIFNIVVPYSSKVEILSMDEEARKRRRRRNLDSYFVDSKFEGCR